MHSWLQSEWERRGGGALVFLPFTLVYWLAITLRRWLYAARILPRWRAPVPVVVVGNISVGGTGKTPLALAILDLLQRRGYTPGVVARGYGRVPPREHDPRGVVRVYPDIATPELFGDEPVLIARRSRVPVYISPDRPAAARALLEAHPEVDVIVSDDGLQHYALARDVELAVVDGERKFGNGLLLPSGPLREPVSRLARVDAMVVNGGGGGPLQTLAPRVFAMHLASERFSKLVSNQELAPPEFVLMARGRNVAAVAGIGNPDRFFEHLAALGLPVQRIAFPDHHHYQASELKLPGAEMIVMTEKDAVKCGAFADARMWFLRVEASLPAEFDDFLLTRIDQARRSADGPQAA
ncbi:MAG TPA: tetraacyldisaccharide 4'-kinase [Usitatibacter sp.]|nr:tetraacyldisaccharide 4'-kinase [Usitatibacter sp.]